MAADQPVRQIGYKDWSITEEEFCLKC